MRKALHGHNKRNSQTYISWSSMRQRCTNKSHHAYSKYGGAGIVVAKEWDDFSVFLADMGVRPPGTSIDRIDNAGDYCKENCRWADRKTQALNRKPMRLWARRCDLDLYEWNGAKYSLPELSRLAGVRVETLRKRIKSGWGVEASIAIPVSPCNAGRGHDKSWRQSWPIRLYAPSDVPGK